ncbi:MAG: hypothetical protein H0S84_13730 [Bacteroidales bacterium]|jgi:hypothetical protein|nr:hypothetical protein [Bacteroidales bacterium]MDN5350095.1 hypothetical protein [Bacteroidales bacterium]
MENNSQDEMIIRETVQPLQNAAGWMKFLGIVLIVYGGLIALSIIGVLIAWLPIWLGVLLVKSSNNTRSAYLRGDKYALIASLRNVGSYFTIYGVLTLIGLIFSVIAIIILLATGVFFDQFDSIMEQIEYM